MTLLDSVRELRELEASYARELFYVNQLLKAAPDLLDVLSGFQEGDANGFGMLVDWMDNMQKSNDFAVHPEIMQLLIRHSDMARCMEEKR